MQRPVRRLITQNEWNDVVFVDGELAHRGHTFTAYVHGRAQNDHVRPGDRAQRAVFEPGHPRHDRAITEAKDEFGSHRHLAAHAEQEPHNCRMPAAQRHEVDHGRRAILGFEGCFQHQGVRPIPAGDLGVAARRNQPASVLGGPEQRGKTGFGIEPWAAEPVDRAVAGHQRRGATIADDRIIFDAGGHCAQENSMMTLISSGCRSSDRVHCSTGSRRVIRPLSQVLSARTSASWAI